MPRASFGDGEGCSYTGYIFGFAHSWAAWLLLLPVLGWHAFYWASLFEAIWWPNYVYLLLPGCALFLAGVGLVANLFLMPRALSNPDESSSAEKFRNYLAASSDKLFYTTFVIVGLVIFFIGVVQYVTVPFGRSEALLTLDNITLADDEGVVVANATADIRRYVTVKAVDVISIVGTLMVVLAFFNSSPAIALSHSFKVIDTYFGVASGGANAVPLAAVVGGRSSGVTSKELLLGNNVNKKNPSTIVI